MAKKSLIVKSNVRKLIRSCNYCCSEDFIHGLNEEVKKLLQEAMKRAEANKRKTVRASDL